MRVLISPDLDITEEIDIELGPDAPCSLAFVRDRSPFCENAAEWACRLACCGHVKTVCGDHRDIAASVLPRIFICVSCGANSPVISSSWRI